MKYRVISNLRVKMAEKNIITKLALSEASDVSRPTLDKIESGDIDSLKFGLLKKVLETLECTFDELFELVPEEEQQQ